MADKFYTNVVEMVRDLGLGGEINEAVEQAIERQRIVRQLMAMRAVRGMSQADVAESMGCSQSRVSKIEKSADVDLRYGDLRKYAHAVGCNLESGVRPRDLEPSEEVKCLAVAVNDRLSRMAELAQGDEAIARGVAQFFVEAFVNFSMIVGRAADALPKNPDGSPRFEVRVKVHEDAAGTARQTPESHECSPNENTRHECEAS